MSLRQRNGVWHLDYTSRSQTRYRFSLKTTDEKEAKRIEAIEIARIEKEELTGIKQNTTFEDACAKWLEIKGGKASIEDDKNYMRYYLQFFRGKPLSYITTERVNRIVEDIKHQKTGKPISDGTKFHYATFMRSLLRLSVDIGYLDRAPKILVKQPNNERVRWLEPELLMRLYHAIKNSFKDAVLFSATTGLRKSNVIQLQWSQVDMQRRVVRKAAEDMKNGTALTVPLTDIAIDVLRRQLGRHQQYVFVNDKGEPFRTDYRHSLDVACKKLGIDDFTFHDLRHCFASWLVQANVPERVLMDLGGWKSKEMVRRYAHLSTDHLREHISHIDNALVTLTSQSVIRVIG